MDGHTHTETYTYNVCVCVSMLCLCVRVCVRGIMDAQLNADIIFQ